MDIGSLAALAGNALVAAAVTEAWGDLRHKISRLFGRGQPDQRILRRLDETHQLLDETAAADMERTQATLAAQWQTRFADLLTDCPEAVAELESLVSKINANLTAAVNESVAAGRDIFVKADRGGVAAIAVHGNVTAGPTMPGPAKS